MKTINIKIYNTKLSKLRAVAPGTEDRNMDTRDLIEVVLDQIPNGGFTPKDIRDRNRIQKVIDNSRGDELAETLVFEDEDFKNLSALANTSRWGSRNADLLDFLTPFLKEDAE